MKLKIIALLTISFGASHAQINNQKAVLEKEVNPGAIIDEIKLPPPKTLGTYFWDDDWHTGTITLYTGKKIENLPLRYDLEHNQIEVQVGNEVKICGNKLAKQFFWIETPGDTSFFVHRNDFQQLLVDNKGIQLLKQITIIEKEADYVPALDVGSKNRKLVKKKNYYLVSNDNVKKFTTNKKKNNLLFGDKADEVSKYLKSNNLKYTKEEDLIKIASYYSSIL